MASASLIRRLPHTLSREFRCYSRKRWTFKGAPLQRCLSTGGLRDIKANDLNVQPSTQPKDKPNEENLVFGESMSDHMLIIEWTSLHGWDTPHIVPYGPLHMLPASSVFHYACEIYEGLKCYRDDNGGVRLFRPMENMKRFNRSAERMCLPTFDQKELLSCIETLIRIDRDWVPQSQRCSLYVRPSLISTEATLGIKPPSKAMLFVITCPVGPYFKSGAFNPVSLLADPQYVRAWPGGVGEYKAGGNYGATVHIQRVAEQRGCNQVLWLFEDKVTEVGTMNLFMHWINEEGEDELITPPLNGLILPGITRDSLLALAREWNDFKVSEKEFTMTQVAKAASEGRVKEIFGSGTACVVCPVNKILYGDSFVYIPMMEDGPLLAKRFYAELMEIQYGRKPHPWSHLVC